jgi:DNA-directed RNA polymerase subunit RPC12/RpoP
MSAEIRPCPTCRGEAELHSVTSASGREEPLAVTLRALPVQRCRHGHVHFTSVDFPLTVLEHLLKEDEKQLPAAEKKGFIFKKFQCAQCDRELLPEADHRHSFEVEMTLPDVKAFIVELSMPVYKCAQCGKEQLHSLDEIRDHTPGALARAFEAAGVAREA